MEYIHLALWCKNVALSAYPPYTQLDYLPSGGNDLLTFYYVKLTTSLPAPRECSAGSPLYTDVPLFFSYMDGSPHSEVASEVSGLDVHCYSGSHSDLN